jgi:nicotinamide phosphoribosyltransferase
VVRAPAALIRALQLTVWRLLPQVNRDTLSFATKLCHIEYADGSTRDVMKAPKTDVNKFSLPGILQVRRDGGVPTVYCTPDAGRGAPLVSDAENLLRVVYDLRPVPDAWDDFSCVRARVKAQWDATPKRADPLSAQLKQRIKQLSPAHAQQLGIS